MRLEYDVPSPPEGAVERTIASGIRRMRICRPSKMPLARLCGLQMGSFSPLYWTAQLMALIAMLCLHSGGTADTASAQLAMMVYAGAISTLACPELMRNIFCRMSEIELSCRISGAELLAARLLIIGAADLAGVTAAAVIAAAKFQTALALTLVTGAALLFSSAFITLIVLRALPVIRSRAAALSLSLTVSAAAGIVCMSVPWSMRAWSVFCAVSFVLLAAELWRELGNVKTGRGNGIWSCA